MGTNMSGLLSRQRNSAEDSDQDQDRGDLKGQQQIAEENTAEICGRDQGAAAELCVAKRRADRKKDKGEQAKQRSDAGKADQISGAAAACALLFTRVEQHDDKRE